MTTYEETSRKINPEDLQPHRYVLCDEKDNLTEAPYDYPDTNITFDIFQNQPREDNEDRPSWHSYFFSIVSLVSQRSTCLNRKVGAVLVRERRIIATGYNGAPVGVPHCSTRGCLRKKLGVASGERHELCWGVHAEMNVVAQAARFGVSTEGTVLYVNVSPCSVCARLLVNAGIKKIYYRGSYPDDLAFDILREAGVPLLRVTVLDKMELEEMKRREKCIERNKEKERNKKLYKGVVGTEEFKEDLDKEDYTKFLDNEKGTNSFGPR